MGELVFSLNDWLAITSALLAAFTPFYILLWKVKEELTDTKIILAEFSAIISHCPTCTRTNGKKT